GAAALLLFLRDLGAGAGDLGFKPGDVFLQFGDAEQGQILWLGRLMLRQQVFFVHRPSPGPRAPSLRRLSPLYADRTRMLAPALGNLVMVAPLMPKATAVWLVENTALTFEQIADFCELHPLEVQAIADGEVAIQMQGLDPVANGQTTAEELERC